MNVLCVGDVCATPGLDFFKKNICLLKNKYNVDAVIVNGENSDEGGLGLSTKSAHELFDAGADIITAGNHSFAKGDEKLYEGLPFAVHPANFPKTKAENGVAVKEIKGKKLAVLNLIGMTGLPPVDNAFECAEHYVTLLAQQGIKHIIIDFHAEATAEKRAMGYLLDGRISALYGTHTHVQTADAQILPCGTGYITDAGMTGVFHSVLGMEIKAAIERQIMQRPSQMRVASGECILSGVLFRLDDESGLCTEVLSISFAESK